MKKWWATIIAVAGSVFSFLLPSIQLYVQHHPQAVVQLTAALVVAAHMAKSPIAK